LKQLLIALGLLLAAPLQAAEYMYCYVGEAPEDAKVSTASPPPMEAFSEFLGVAVIRHACGVDTMIDRQLMQRELETAECSESSEIALYAGELLSTPPEALAEIYAKQLKMNADGFAAFCGSLSSCEPDADTAYAPACFEALKKAVGG
jgi:hypothetical protein